MSLYQNLTEAIENGILIITISRPESLNALNTETLDELRTAIQEAYDNKEIRGIIITGAGEKSFVAGADIKEIAELNELNARKFAENGQEIFSLIEQCEKPVIAAVNGFALGGGCELAMACHIRIASENAKFGQPEVTLGIIPGYGGTQRLTQLVGKGKALELIATGDMISANEAKNIGLVNHVVETQDELMELSKKIMSKIVSKAPLAVGMAINCVNAFYAEENGYQTEANSFSNCTKTKDFQEGTMAFIEKRKPEFKGE
ncbi:enoyl-CoA hydratase/isomerase family protein [Fulvivirga sediminis]|uniref:Enoyl-CoA hydratase/isomerase family protein n=1 Tax=Fulvivirga sediminis TaxID=2803949 RepID=A0A937F6L5_9BACT|nr:enoyl-CoA hydratase-related protein [Fulvivirga sediminis]MBL3655033.1 enoyl-CoA hydratase/isomerase family protein [Fulvivirga sediminis]